MGNWGDISRPFFSDVLPLMTLSRKGALEEGNLREANLLLVAACCGSTPWRLRLLSVTLDTSWIGS